jgi:hypothetical protein
MSWTYVVAAVLWVYGSIFFLWGVCCLLGRFTSWGDTIDPIEPKPPEHDLRRTR